MNFAKIEANTIVDGWRKAEAEHRNEKVVVDPLASVKTSTD